MCVKPSIGSPSASVSIGPRSFAEVIGFVPWWERVALHVLPTVLSVRSVFALMAWSIFLMMGFGHVLYVLDGGSARNTFSTGSLYYFFLPFL